MLTHLKNTTPNRLYIPKEAALDFIEPSRESDTCFVFLEAIEPIGKFREWSYAVNAKIVTVWLHEINTISSIRTHLPCGRLTLR